MSNLLSYWPTSAHVVECLRTEAETIDEALLLAVHEPVTLLRRAAQTGAESAATESDLLNELMRPAHDGSAVLVAITGASGVGKSHMVRWLHAQLLRHPERDRLVIISIPKTASLRQVLELILEPLGGEAFQTLKRDLSRVTDSLDPPRAAELLAATISSELEAYAKRVETDIRADQSKHRLLGPRINIAKRVRTLTRDPNVRDKWFEEVLIRIVGASLGGASDPDERRFSALDLTPPESLSLGDFHTDTQGALAYLARNDAQDRAVAAEILQEVLDPALRTLFGFAETFRQKTIQEVVDEIRRQLLIEGKELVLLIEDLAALAGIQQPLLDIVIAESIYQGKWVRAPIRTALAVTDGFLPGRQTLLTRARAEWVIPSEGMSDEMVVQRLVDMTGRYLNAARWGLAELNRRFEESSPRIEDLYAWVPKFHEDIDSVSAEQLKAFGSSASGYPLFPFSELAVRSLGQHALKRAGQWVFNPRAFINDVLRETLRLRDRFESHSFPVKDFKQPSLLSGVRQALEFKSYSQAQRDRLESALYHWAGAPTSLTEAPQVSKAVFDAFNLPWPFDADFRAPAARPLSPPTVETKKSTHVTPPEEEQVLGDSRYAAVLEDWSPTTRLTSTFPNRTRQLLAAALNARLNPDNLRLHGQKVDFKWFWLPPEGTVGNRGTGFVIRLAEPGQAIPPILVQGLRALDRWESNSRSWAYTNAESEYADAQALLDILEPKAVQLLEFEAQRDLRILCTVLHRQNLLLGLSKKAEPEGPRVQELMATASPEIRPSDNEVIPAPVRQVLNARAQATASRATLQALFRYRLGCYQGATGGRVLAMDVERLRNAWKLEVTGSWSLFTEGRDPLDPSTTDALDRLSDTGLSQLLRHLQTAQETFRPSVADAFDEDHARVTWREDLLSTIQQAKQLSLWPANSNENRLQEAIKNLSAEGLETITNAAKSFEQPDPQRSLDVHLARWSTLSLPDLIKVAQDVQTLETFLGELERTCAEQVTAMGQEEALRQRDELINSLVWDLQ